MKVIFVADCNDCPCAGGIVGKLICAHQNGSYEVVPKVGIRHDCPLEELGVVSKYTRTGSTETKIKETK